MLASMAKSKLITQSDLIFTTHPQMAWTEALHDLKANESFDTSSLVPNHQGLSEPIPGPGQLRVRLNAPRGDWDIELDGENVA